MERRFKKSVLANGIRVVSEFHPESRAVALGVWVDVGTRDERAGQIGISHLLEHMVFKGTKTRSSYGIAKSLEALGGELNAFTSRENTCYHALVLKDHWSEALDILTDLVSNMKFSRKDFNLEKGVILQEIAMAEESPEEFIFDNFFEYCYGKHPLGRSILGNLKTITHMKMGEVYSHYKETYQGSNILVSAAGNIDHEELVQKSVQLLAHKKKRKASKREVKPRWNAHRWIKEKETEQVHFLVGLPFPSFKSPDRFAGVIINSVLGGGMTSRLYQSVRERRGLAYSIYSMMNSFVDAGVLNIYAGIDPEKVEELAELISHELRKIKKQGLKKSEIDNYKTQVVGSLLLGADDVDNRMNSIAVNEFVFEEYNSPEDVVKSVRAVNSDDLHEFIDQYIRPEKVAGVLMGAQSFSNGRLVEKLGVYVSAHRLKVLLKKWAHFKGELPAYQSQGASGFDIRAQITQSIILNPGERVMIPTGLSFEVPLGFEIQARPRSGWAAKEGLTVLNTPGTIDADYRGEVKIILINLGKESVTIKDQDRIAQLVIAPVILAEFSLVEELGQTERGIGGFGSTGRV